MACGQNRPHGEVVKFQMRGTCRGGGEEEEGV